MFYSEYCQSVKTGLGDTDSRDRLTSEGLKEYHRNAEKAPHCKDIV